jgi:hypothetical protein
MKYNKRCKKCGRFIRKDIQIGFECFNCYIEPIRKFTMIEWNNFKKGNYFVHEKTV